MTRLLHIADRVLGQPLLLEPGKAAVILDVLAGRIGLDDAQASRFEGSPLVDDGGGRPRMRPYNVTKDGVAVITIAGSLVSRGAWIGADSGLISYEGVQHQLKTAVADDKVRAVILDMHSPGGEVLGCFETAAMVRQLAGAKRTVAVVNGMAASAAYAIAAGASEIVTTETGMSGSIGVILLHLDNSKRLEKEGVAATLIIAGARKADGNPFEPLSDRARGDSQARVSAIYDLFLAAVAAGRGGRMTVDKARATEARVFTGADAVKVGLADRVGSFESVLADLSKPGGRRALPPAPASPSAAQTAPASPYAAMIDKAIAAALAAPVAPVALSPADAARAERQRAYEAAPPLRAVWKTFDDYDAFVAASEAMAAKQRTM